MFDNCMKHVDYQFTFSHANVTALFSVLTIDPLVANIVRFVYPEQCSGSSRTDPVI